MSTDDEIAALQARVNELEKNLRDLKLYVSESFSLVWEQIGRLAKASLDAHDRLVPLEEKNFPSLYPDLDHIADLVPPVDPLASNPLDYRAKDTGKKEKD